MDKVDQIDFVTVVYKRVIYAKLIHESIKKYVNYPYTYYIVNNGDNTENSLELKKLNELFKDEPNVVIVKGVQQVNQDDGSCVPAQNKGKYPQSYFIKNYNWDGYSKYDRRALGFGSWLQAKGMTIGTKMGKGKYICQVEHDVVFLNSWVDHILPLLEENSFISYCWRHDIDQALTPQFSVVKREIIENDYYKEEGDLYPNCHYKDTYGLLSLWARETNKPYIILPNSWNDRSLKSKHLLKFKHGDEGFIDGVPYLHHAGRGSARSQDIADQWINEVSEYLNIKL
tara:strand:- start:11164 stop:12018 length:855 start_codon:yes stop_codon:yes gene_type:complete